MSARALLITQDQLDAVGADFGAMRESLVRAGAIEAFTPPAIGDYWPGQGGTYAGLVRGEDGAPDHHLILADTKPASELTWAAAKAWASTVSVDSRKDFTLPSRRESSVLFANLGEKFERRWHWTRDAYAGSGSYAWVQSFGNGAQDGYPVDDESCARAVRRFIA